jgi:nitronate monooxygenase
MTRTPLSELGLSLPLVAAPMAGGPTTPALVVAAARAGALGFLAGGYETAASLGEQIEEVRRQTPTFGVNLFAPNPLPVDPSAYDRFVAVLNDDAERYGVSLPVSPVENDDDWQHKIDLLVEKPVRVVSFTFGIPDAPSLSALRRAGSILVQTVTSAAEAQLAVDAGVDVLAVQASAAGGHSATLTPHRVPPPRPLLELVADISHATGLPTIAAGGLAGPDDVAAVLRAGAEAAMVGTVLLLSPESGTSAAYRKALAAQGRDTVVTRAFTGRPARGLRNLFTDRYDAVAPSGYPALHYLTRPLRRAAVAAGDPELVNLWAGAGYRAATPEPSGRILQALAAEL